MKNFLIGLFTFIGTTGISAQTQSITVHSQTTGKEEIIDVPESMQSEMDSLYWDWQSIFGSDAAAERFYNYDSLRVGDQARIQGDSHTVFILEKTDDYVIVAECNADYETCMISWGRKIMREDLQGYYITRWN